MRCKNVCPKKMLYKSKCINKRIFESSNEYKQEGDLCKVINYQIKWSNCSLIPISKFECGKNINFKLTNCVNGQGYVMAVRKVAKNKVCVEESRKIATINCDAKCEKNIEEKTVSGKCENKLKFIFKISKKLQGNLCVQNVTLVKKEKCGDSKCPSDTYNILPCGSNSKATFLIRTFYTNNNTTCVKYTKKLKEVSCNCYKTSKGNLTVTIGKLCDKGFRSKELIIQEERQGKCVDVKFTLRRIKCAKSCLRLKIKVLKCKSNKRELVKLRGTLVNGKCEWKTENKRVVKCKNICPSPKKKTTLCIRKRKALLEITFKEKGDFCKASIKKIKVIKCEKSKGCRNSTYEIAKCDKNDKVTFLLKTFYRSDNKSCIKKTRKIKELSCKCYQTSRTNISVTIGKTCEKGFRSRELTLQEERQGKCVDVKFTLRRKVCIKRCFKREYRITKCKNNKREVSKYRSIFVKGICEWKLDFKNVLECKTPCPSDQKKMTKCIFNKKALLEIKFKEEKENCKATVKRLKLLTCTKPKKCGNTTYEVSKCDKNAKTTFLLRNYFTNINGICSKKVKKVRELSCKCYENRNRAIFITIGKICEKGYHTRELILHVESQGQCTDIKFKLKQIKCIVRCLKVEYKMSKCKNNKREIVRYQESLVNGKCEWKVVENKTKECKNPCPNPKRKVTRCVLGKQALLEATSKEEAGRCKTTVVRLKLMKCNQTKECHNSTYEVTKCTSNSKTTPLIRNYYENVNNTCIKKSRKVKDLSCKCYVNTKTSVTITIGKACENGFKSRELILYEERQGKCVNVKMTLRKIRCDRQCGGVKTIPGPCTNQKRVVKSYENILINGTCTWKFIRESVINCSNACPQPKTSETPCLFGKKTLIRKTYKLIGKTCIPNIQRIRVMTCKNCTERSVYKVENCTKNSITSNLVRISFKDCKQKVEVLKKIDCTCYQLNRNTLRISAASQCNNGTKTRTLYYFDKGKSTCEKKEYVIKGIKCGCYGGSVVMSICKNGNRTLTFFKKEKSAEKCLNKKLNSRTMRCKNVCPKKMVYKSKCINKRIFESSNEYKQEGDLCKVINYQIKWSNCNLTLIPIKRCSNKYDFLMTTCVNSTASIIAKRQVLKVNKCMEESRKIAVVDCDARKCERTVKPKIIGGRCEKNLKLIFSLSTKSMNNKCYHKVFYLGKMKCKDC